MRTASAQSGQQLKLQKHASVLIYWKKPTVIAQANDLIQSGWRSLAREKKSRLFMKRGVGKLSRVSEQCGGVAEEGRSGPRGETLHLVANEPLTGSVVLISSVCFHRLLRVHSAIVLLGRPCCRSQALEPLFVKWLPCFFAFSTWG